MAITKTNNLNVTASVAANCTITAVTDVSFGAYDPTSATDLDVNGDITFRCTKNTSYKTYMVDTRQMVGAVNADNLDFELYSDAGRTTVFPSDNDRTDKQETFFPLVTNDSGGKKKIIDGPVLGPVLNLHAGGPARIAQSGQ